MLLGSEGGPLLHDVNKRGICIASGSVSETSTLALAFEEVGEWQSVVVGRSGFSRRLTSSSQGSDEGEGANKW